MSTATFPNIGLRPAQQRAIEKRARLAGQTPSQYLRALVERDLLAAKSFAEILRPIRDDVRNSGLTEVDLDVIVDRARKATAPKRRTNKRKASR